MRSLRWALVAVLIAIRVLAVDAVLDDPAAYKRGTAYSYDANNYHHIAEKQGTPHVDFELEFPPVTYAYVKAINGATTADTMHTLAWSSLAFDFLAALALVYAWGRRAGAVYLVAGTPLLLYPFFYWRVDFLVVALAAWALALLKRRHQVAGGVTLAVAAFAKFWPLALAPVFLVRNAKRGFIAFFATAAVGGIGWLAYAGTAGPEQVITFRGATGWQIESVVGGIYRAITGSPVFRQSGAARTGVAPMWASALLGLLMVTLVAWMWWRVANARDVDDTLIDGVVPLTAVTTFMVCSPLLSPQYMVWLLPFAAVSWVLGARRIAALAGIAIVGTMLLVRDYQGFKHGDTVPTAILLARNGVLLLLVVEGVRMVATLPQRAVNRPRRLLLGPIGARAATPG